MAKVLQTVVDGAVNFGDGAVLAWFEQNLDRYRPTSLDSPCKTDNSPFKGIQRTIQNLLNDIKNYDTIAELFGGGDPKREQFIQKLLDIASGDIAGYMKSLFDSIRAYAFNALMEVAKKQIPYLFPSETPEYIKNLNEGDNFLSCIFNKLVRQLPGIIKGLLSKMLKDDNVDTPLCAAENLASDVLKGGGILDQISNGVKTAISLFSKGAAFVNDLLSSVFNLLDFVTGLLNFFKCDDDPDCPQQGEINLAGELSTLGDNFVPIDNLYGGFTSYQGGGNSASAVIYQV